MYRIARSRPSLSKNIPNDLETCQKELVYYLYCDKRKLYEIKDLHDKNRGLHAVIEDLHGAGKGFRDMKDLCGENERLRAMLQIMSSLVLFGLMISLSIYVLFVL